MITVCLQYNINSARAVFLATEVTWNFFLPPYYRSHFSHPSFTNCKLHTSASLTLISSGYGVLRSTWVIHTKLKRPGTRSNRLGPDPDPDPADRLKYRPEPVWVPGPRVSGPPWRPLQQHTPPPENQKRWWSQWPPHLWDGRRKTASRTWRSHDAGQGRKVIFSPPDTLIKLRWLGLARLVRPI